MPAFPLIKLVKPGSGFKSGRNCCDQVLALPSLRITLFVDLSTADITLWWPYFTLQLNLLPHIPFQTVSSSTTIALVPSLRAGLANIASRHSNSSSWGLAHSHHPNHPYDLRPSLACGLTHSLNLTSPLLEIWTNFCKPRIGWPLIDKIHRSWDLFVYFIWIKYIFGLLIYYWSASNLVCLRSFFILSLNTHKKCTWNKRPVWIKL